MNNDKLIQKIEKFSSNVLTRMVSRLDIPLFDKDAKREHKYRMSVLNGLVDLKQSLDYFSQNILGTSGESIFKAIQYLSSSNRQLDSIISTLNVYTQEEKDQQKENSEEFENLVKNIIHDFNLNKLNFDFNESSYFLQLDKLIDKYLSGNLFLEDEIIDNYKKLLSSLSANKEGSLSDIFQKRLKSTASLTGDVKKWFGNLLHNFSLFDKTSAVRLEAANKAKDALKLVNDVIDIVEKELDPYELFESFSELKNILNYIKITIKPLSDLTKGMGYSDEFIKMLEKNKLNEFSVGLSDKEKKTFENYLNRKDYKNLANIYND